MAKKEEERQKRKQLRFKNSQDLKKDNDYNSMQFTTVDFDSLIMLNPDDPQVFIVINFLEKSLLIIIYYM